MVLGGGIDLSVPGIISLVNVVAAKQMSSPGWSWTVLCCCSRSGGCQASSTAFSWSTGACSPSSSRSPTGSSSAASPSTSCRARAARWTGQSPRIFSKHYFGLAGPTWLFLMLVAFSLWFSRTRLGYSIRAIGSDRVSARHSGVRLEARRNGELRPFELVRRLGGIVLSLQSLSGEPTAGNSYVLPMITALVVGGVSLLGGRGSLVGPVVGAVVLTYLTGVTFALSSTTAVEPDISGRAARALHLFHAPPPGGPELGR